MARFKKEKKRTKLWLVLLIETVLVIVIVGGLILYYRNEILPNTGYKIKDGKPLYFDSLGRPSQTGWIHIDEGDYYCIGKGALATGWKYLDGKAYYFYQEEDADEKHRLGAQARDFTTEGKIKIPKTGYVDGDEGLTIAYSIDVLDRFGWDLESAYRYSAALGFITGNEEHYGFTIPGCAIQGFKHGEGNCLAWAGTLCAMAKVMGYDAYLVWGSVHWNDKDYPHGWVEIKMSDGVHVYDPRKNDGKDMTGFDVRYGEKGTRKYNEDDRKYVPW